MRSFGKILVGGCMLGMLLLGVMALQTAAAESALKQTYATAGYLTDKSGRVLRTSPALTSLPILAAPHLSTEQVVDLHSVAATTFAPGLDMLKAVTHRIASYEAINATAARMTTMRREEILVANGAASLLTLGGVKLPLCAAHVRFASSQAGGADALAHHLEYARAALDGAGVALSGGLSIETCDAILTEWTAPVTEVDSYAEEDDDLYDGEATIDSDSR